jgi:hypothetical protein
LGSVSSLVDGVVDVDATAEVADAADAAGDDAAIAARKAVEHAR